MTHAALEFHLEQTVTCMRATQPKGAVIITGGVDVRNAGGVIGDTGISDFIGLPETFKRVFPRRAPQRGQEVRLCNN